MDYLNENALDLSSVELFNPALLQEVLNSSTNWENIDLDDVLANEQLDIQEISFSEFTSTLR